MRIERQELALICCMTLLCILPFSAHAQTIKAGLWETQSTITNTMSLPPDVEARLAAMPVAQQAQVRSMMGGVGGGQPVSVTNKSCVAGKVTMDSLLSQQQKSAMKCTFTNRTQTADGASFDTSCTSPQGTATGHTQLHFVDDEHASGTTHMTMDMTSRGQTTHMTVDNTMSAKWLAADCGDVKPAAPPAAN